MSKLDWLAEKTLDVLRTQSTLNQSWIDDKRIALSGQSRLDVLRWIVTSLDDNNKAIVSDALEIDVADLEAVGRVLKAI
jgi:hypothetical protein